MGGEFVQAVLVIGGFLGLLDLVFLQIHWFLIFGIFLGAYYTVLPQRPDTMWSIIAGLIAGTIIAVYVYFVAKARVVLEDGTEEIQPYWAGGDFWYMILMGGLMGPAIIITPFVALTYRKAVKKVKELLGWNTEGFWPVLPYLFLAELTVYIAVGVLLGDTPFLNF